MVDSYEGIERCPVFMGSRSGPFCVLLIGVWITCFCVKSSC